MALDPATLAASIKEKLLAAEDSGAQDGDALEAFCTAIAEAVVERIVADAVATVDGVEGGIT